MKSRKSNSLTALIERIDWLAIEPGTKPKLQPNGISISFVAGDPKKFPDNINQVKMRFGHEIIQKMGWELGNRIAVLHDPDDLLSFMFVKTETGKGFKLSHETGTNVSKLHFRWDRSLKLEAMKAKEVKYHIHKDCIVIFRVDNQDEIEE